MTTSIVDWDNLDKEVATNPLLKQIGLDLTTNAKTHAGFELYNNKLLFKDRYAIPRSSSFVPKLMKSCHDSSVGGHAGDVKTYLRLAA